MPEGGTALGTAHIQSGEPDVVGLLLAGQLAQPLIERAALLRDDLHFRRGRKLLHIFGQNREDIHHELHLREVELVSI